MLQMDTLWAQFIRTVLQVTITVGSLIILLGKDTVMTLIGGFSIGFGYAFQPCLLGAMNAIYLRGENKFKDHVVSIAGVTGVVEATGLFHMRIRESKTGNIVYISNLKLTENVSLFSKGRGSDPDFVPDRLAFRKL